METAHFWGVADNGDVVEIEIAATLYDRMMACWPAMGLEPRFDPPAEGARRIAHLGLSNEGLVVPGVGVEVGDDPPDSAWRLMEQTLTLLAVERLAHLVAVHSAVIAWKGSVLLVPAMSGAGKSTLTVAAAQAGAQVLSDEYALIDPDHGLVTGWVRPVRMRRDDGTRELIDLARESEPLPVGLVAAVTYDPETAPGSPGTFHDTSSAQVVMDLLASTLCARTRPDASLDAALAVARSARGIGGTRGEAAVAIGHLLALMEGQGPVEPRTA